MSIRDDVRRPLYRPPPPPPINMTPAPYTTFNQPVNQRLQLTSPGVTSQPTSSQAITQDSQLNVQLITNGLNSLMSRINSAENQTRLTQNALDIATAADTALKLRKSLEQWRYDETKNLDDQISDVLSSQGITKADIQRNPRVRQEISKWKQRMYANLNANLNVHEQKFLAEAQAATKNISDLTRKGIIKVGSSSADGTTYVLNSNAVGNLTPADMDNLKDMGFDINPIKEYQQLQQDIESLSQSGTIYKAIDGNEISLAKTYADLTPEDIAKLNRLGFTITPSTVAAAKNITGTTQYTVAEIAAQNKVFKEALAQEKITTEQYNLAIAKQNANLSAVQTLVVQLSTNGLIKISGDQMTLNKPVANLTKTDIKNLNKIGFNITTTDVTNAKALTSSIGTANFTPQQISEQNQKFKEAYESGKISASEYDSAISRQNANLQSIHSIATDLISRGVLKESDGKYSLATSLFSLSSDNITNLKTIGFEFTPEQISQVNACNTLQKAGAISIQNGQMYLQTPLETLPDNLYIAAQTLGFQGGGTSGKGPSFLILDWIQSNAPNGIISALISTLVPKTTSQKLASFDVWDRLQSPAGPVSTFVGGVERSVIQPLNFLISGIEKLVSGKSITSDLAVASFTQQRVPSQKESLKIDIRTVSPDTIKYLGSTSPDSRVLLEGMSLAGHALGTYLVSLPVGAAADQIFSAAKSIAPSIASKLGVSTPIAVSKIASAIASHPDLTRIVLYGTAVGLTNTDLIKLYDQWTKGQIDTGYFARTIAERGVGTIAGIKGFESGTAASRKFREWWTTRGRDLIPLNEILPQKIQEQLRTSHFPKYTRDLDIQQWSSEYKEWAKTATAEGYLGKLAPEEYRIWHASGDVWQTRLYEATTAGYGDFYPKLSTAAGEFGTVYKFPGLFASSVPSPYFLRTGTESVSGIAKTLTLPGMKGTPYIVSVDALIDVMPSGMSKTQIWEWLTAQAGKKTAYIPPIGMISAEMEAIIPANSVMVKVGQGWYTNYAGHYVLIDKYVLVPSTLASILLSANLPKGMTATLATDVIKESLITKDVLLSWGFLPQDISSAGQSVNMPLLDAHISMLSKQYGVSESEVISILNNLGYSYDNIQTALSVPALTSTLTSESISGLINTASISMPTTDPYVSVTVPEISIPTSAVPHSVPIPTTPISSSLDLAQLLPPLPEELPVLPHFNLQLKDTKRMIFKELILFDVKLIYSASSEQYTIKSNSFHGAAREALSRRKTQHVPNKLIIKRIK